MMNPLSRSFARSSDERATATFRINSIPVACVGSWAMGASSGAGYPVLERGQLSRVRHRQTKLHVDLTLEKRLRMIELTGSGNSI
jgi:hypothetical protein